MSTWSRHQVDQVAGLRASVSLSLEAVARARDDVMQFSRGKLVQRLIGMAHAFAVEPHLGDFRFREHSPEEAWGNIEVRCWWEPQTDEVEFVGGENDGMILAVRDAPREPVVVASSASLPLLTYTAATNPDEPITWDRQIYSMSGWRETERRWVYTA